MTVLTKRVYEPRSPEDGFRLLVMHYWPRGIRKAHVDGWDKGLAPTRGLLADIRSGAIDSPEYRNRYLLEMATRQDSAIAVEALRERARNETVTLLCWCHDENRCHRSLLRDLVMNEA